MASNIITLSEPYEFEGETYTEIDLQGLKALKLKDLKELEDIFIARGGNVAMEGLTLDYAVITANRVTKKPIEFFDDLPSKDIWALRNEVVRSFFG